VITIIVCDIKATKDEKGQTNEDILKEQVDFFYDDKEFTLKTTEAEAYNIKINATRNFTTSERAVTKNDYKNIILKDYPQIQDVIVWGGEENDPPDYGKVFISIKPISGSSLSDILFDV